jgi:hypothetical protein
VADDRDFNIMESLLWTSWFIVDLSMWSIRSKRQDLHHLAKRHYELHRRLRRREPVKLDELRAFCAEVNRIRKTVQFGHYTKEIPDFADCAGVMEADLLTIEGVVE